MMSYMFFCLKKAYLWSSGVSKIRRFRKNRLLVCRADMSLNSDPSFMPCCYFEISMNRWWFISRFIFFLFLNVYHPLKFILKNNRHFFLINRIESSWKILKISYLWIWFSANGLWSERVLVLSLWGVAFYRDN